MIDTLEVRWFQAGSPPKEATAWMRDLGAEAESTRTDAYLWSDDPGVNVKLREGQIQTKRRVGAPSRIEFGSSVSGMQERWVKWCFPTLEQHQDLLDDEPTGSWVPVHKERVRRTIEPAEQRRRLDQLIETDPAVVKIELTNVRSRSHRAWTVCVEAEGEPEALPGTLEQMGHHLFARRAPLTLSVDHSFGYVHWLQDVLASDPDAGSTRR